MNTYDTFSSDYDKFVNWEGRLAFELPFLEQQMQAAPGKSVLDAACGTGMHAIALAQRGYAAAGADLSAGMIEQARRNAEAAGVRVDLRAAGFGGLAETFPRPFGALICLGNSLPHVSGPLELAAALEDFAACLVAGGVLVLQNRNFDAVTAARARWMEPQGYREGEREWVFVRFYDYLPDGNIQFNILTLTRQGAGGWGQQVTTTFLYPLLHRELSEALREAGFGQIQAYGSLNGEPFAAASSGNLVITAVKKQ